MTEKAYPEPDRATLIRLSGLDYMRAMLTGEIAAPPIWNLLNIHLTSVEAGRVAFRGAAAPEHGNVTGTVHGGWYGAVLDACMGCAVMTGVPSGATSTTVEFKTNIVSVAPIGTEVEAVGLVSHAGRRTGVATGEIRGIANGKLFATGSTTCLIMPAD